MNIYILREGNQEGPFSEEATQNMLKQGSVLIGDLAWRAAPLTDRAAAALVDEPRAAPLLHGYRGSAPVDRDALIDLLLRVGRLADDHPEVRALSLNPVLARPDGYSVLHAHVETGEARSRSDSGPRRLKN